MEEKAKEIYDFCIEGIHLGYPKNYIIRGISKQYGTGRVIASNIYKTAQMFRDDDSIEDRIQFITDLLNGIPIREEQKNEVKPKIEKSKMTKTSKDKKEAVNKSKLESNIVPKEIKTDKQIIEETKKTIDEIIKEMCISGYVLKDLTKIEHSDSKIIQKITNRINELKKEIVSRKDVKQEEKEDMLEMFDYLTNPDGKLNANMIYIETLIEERIKHRNNIEYTNLNSEYFRIKGAYFNNNKPCSLSFVFKKLKRHLALTVIAKKDYEKGIDAIGNNLDKLFIGERSNTLQNKEIKDSGEIR